MTAHRVHLVPLRGERIQCVEPGCGVEMVGHAYWPEGHPDYVVFCSLLHKQEPDHWLTAFGELPPGALRAVH